MSIQFLGFVFPSNVSNEESISLQEKKVLTEVT